MADYTNSRSSPRHSRDIVLLVELNKHALLSIFNMFNLKPKTISSITLIFYFSSLLITGYNVKFFMAF